MDSTRFEKLVNEHKDAVYRQMVRVCNHREDAEDALATALMQAFRAYDKLESDEAFRTWLATIGRRVCSRMRSHSGIQTAFEYAEEHDLVADNKSEFELAVLKGCVKDAVNELPEIYKDIYQKCEIEEKTVIEAAEELGITHNAAKSRLLRARVIVREKLDQSVCAA
ncbi:MAG: sigma-70 family RNA polymerase sigma factor [Armatimonadetes bacterium]|nr:sigma-70 family RNA polymerase sigma factor [Armatimonadota bacterium]MBS1726876.1 sigma-70 family RNA polymerase sigma factor [Armatimonadota bacterium]